MATPGGGLASPAWRSELPHLSRHARCRVLRHWSASTSLALPELTSVCTAPTGQAQLACSMTGMLAETSDAALGGGENIRHALG